MGAGSRPVFVLAGLTASGKKKVGIETASIVDAEIISLDSMKVYRGMDIGTAKPSAGDRSRIKFHMLDMIDPDESFSVGRFLEKARDEINEIHARNRRVLFLGGTAFYLNCLLNGIFSEPPDTDDSYRKELIDLSHAGGADALHEKLRRLDPESAGEIHPHDLKRIVRALEVIHTAGKPLSWLKKNRTERIVANPTVLAGLRRPSEDLEGRIKARTSKMIAAGLVDEVNGIREGGGFGIESAKAIGYREIISHLDGELTLAEAEKAINRNTLRFVKKQKTWYKRFPAVHWFEMKSPADVKKVSAAIARYFLDAEKRLLG